MVVVLLAFSASLAAAPRLGLNQTAFGPISVSAGAAGPTQTLTAQNLGDGTLNVSALPNVPWLLATVGARRGCNQVGGECYPVQITLNTAGLAAGMHTGSVTFTAPNALDSPQTVTVTVAVGGNVPDQISLYVPANGTGVKHTFQTSTNMASTVTAPANGPSLAVVAKGGGSFATTATYDIVAQSRSAVAEGTYNGSIRFTGSSVPAENKTVQVAMNVTSQPIASATGPVRIRMARDAARQTTWIPVTNPGSGTLTLSGATAAAQGGGTWMTGSVFSNFAGVTIDPSSLAPGNYTGTLTVASNAANASLAIPVQLEVVAPGPPLAYAGGAVSNADFAPGPLAPGDLPALFGEQFTTGEAQAAASLPLPSTLGGVQVMVNDVPAPIYYVSAGQINFQIPFNTTPGGAVIRVVRNGQTSNSIYARIDAQAPRLHSATLGANKVAAANSAPLGPIRRGETLVIWALGLGATTPSVASGAAAPVSPLAVPLVNQQVVLGSGSPDTGGLTMTPAFQGLAPGFVGLYQINVLIPANAPAGTSIPLTLRGPLGQSNALLVNIQ